MVGLDEPNGDRTRLLGKGTFPATYSALAAVRTSLREWTEKVGVGGDKLERLQLAVHEACANAIDHPQDKSDISLWAWQKSDRVSVDVWHAGEFHTKTSQDRRHRGMGLPLMVASTDEVSFTTPAGGGIQVSLSTFLERPAPSEGGAFPLATEVRR